MSPTVHVQSLARALTLTGLALLFLLAGCGGEAPAADLGVVDEGPVDLGPDAGDSGVDANGPRLDAPDLLRLPYVDAGAGSVTATLELTNSGSVSLTLGVEWMGDAPL